VEVVRFTGELFLTDNGSWFFVRLPIETADEVRDLTTGPPTGFGSVKVEVTIGSSTWRTSVFPETAAGTFVLPVKKAVRAAEDLEDGDTVEVSLLVLG
jgi:hypothetical protein